MPNEVDITKFINSTSLEFEIEVAGHRRNSHGPLHYHPKYPFWTGPEEFESTGSAWNDNYQLVECGLMKNPYLELRQYKNV